MSEDEDQEYRKRDGTEDASHDGRDLNRNLEAGFDDARFVEVRIAGCRVQVGHHHGAENAPPDDLAPSADADPT